jgi:hypothetical protein
VDQSLAADNAIPATNVAVAAAVEAPPPLGPLAALLQKLFNRPPAVQNAPTGNIQLADDLAGDNGSDTGVAPASSPFDAIAQEITAQIENVTAAEVSLQAGDSYRG